MITFLKKSTIILILVLLVFGLESCSFLLSRYIKPQKRIKKEGPAIYISSNFNLLINKRVLIFPVRVGPNSGELGFDMSNYIKQCIKKWRLFSKLDVCSFSYDNIFTAINKAKELGYPYMIWLDCPILLPPGVNPNEPGEIKMTFRIIDTQTQNTCWYIEEKIFWFNDYNAWVINDTSQALPLAIKTMLNIMCNDWHKVIIPNIQNKNKKAGLISRFLLKFSPTLSPIS